LFYFLWKPPIISPLFQIRKFDGTEADVPGVILIIPPPDRKAVHENQKYVSLLQ
jgi:hypothetical protein